MLQGFSQVSFLPGSKHLNIPYCLKLLPLQYYTLLGGTMAGIKVE